MENIKEKEMRLEIKRGYQIWAYRHISYEGGPAIKPVFFSESHVETLNKFAEMKKAPQVIYIEQGDSVPEGYYVFQQDGPKRKCAKFTVSHVQEAWIGEWTERIG